MLYHSNLKLKDVKGNNALIKASEYGYFDIVEELTLHEEWLY